MKRNGLILLLTAVICIMMLSTGCKRKPPQPAPETPPQVTEPMETPSTEPTLTEDELRLIKLGEAQEILGSQDIYFAYDQSTLDEKAKSVLAKKAEYLVRNTDIQVTVEGHCDERGSNEYNLALGERRAASVKKYLVTYGVKESMINTITFGEEKPVCTDHAESCWSKNRRAAFNVNR